MVAKALKTPTVNDCQRFPVKSLVPTSRRDAIGSGQELLHFGTTSGVFAGVRWEFDHQRMVLVMGKEWEIAIEPSPNGHGSATYVKEDGKFYKSLYVIDGLVGTRSGLKYRSQGDLSPYERREWKKTKRERATEEMRPLKARWTDPASYGIKKKKTRTKARSGSVRRSKGSSDRARKAPPAAPRDTKCSGSASRRLAIRNAVGLNGRSTTGE
jgi:hypothetical protein